MKAKFLKLPVYQQGLFLTLIWLMVGVGVMLYRWPTSDLDFQTTAYWLAPNLIRMHGKVTAESFPFVCGMSIGISWYVFSRFKNQGKQAIRGVNLFQVVWPIWVFTSIAVFLLNLWLPQTRMTQFTGIDRQVLMLALLFIEVPLISSLVLWLVSGLPSHGLHRFKDLIVWAVFALGSIYIVSHLQFRFAGNLLSMQDQEQKRAWLTMPFWPSWLIGVVLTAGIWWAIARHLHMIDYSCKDVKEKNASVLQSKD
ncbi:hypothetical protein [Lacticaseibacillus paracasei]|uniref:hypothetical protein n=1 Tax=Lacticaseibacillus paracasei TaxID=1597 RepID=UPI0021A66231|nr:hypothetical protein [Lacticaseibacillus paracasei]